MKRHGENLNTLLSEGSKSENPTYCVIPTPWHSEKDKTMETIKRSVVARGWEEGEINRRKHRGFRAVKLFYYNDG